MNLLSRGPGQEIDKLELEFINYNIREDKSKAYISAIHISDWFFSRFVLSEVGLHQFNHQHSGTAALLPS